MSTPLEQTNESRAIALRPVETGKYLALLVYRVIWTEVEDKMQDSLTQLLLISYLLQIK